MWGANLALHVLRSSQNRHQPAECHFWVVARSVFWGGWMLAVRHAWTNCIKNGSFFGDLRYSSFSWIKSLQNSSWNWQSLGSKNLAFELVDFLQVVSVAEAQEQAALFCFDAWKVSERQNTLSVTNLKFQDFCLTTDSFNMFWPKKYSREQRRRTLKSWGPKFGELSKDLWRWRFLGSIPVPVFQYI